MARHLLFLPRSARGPAFFLWPDDAERPGSSAVNRLGAVGTGARARVVTDRRSVATVRGRSIPFLDAVAILAGVEAAELERLPASIAGWSLAAKLALELVARERVLPLAEANGRGVTVRWGVSLALPHDGDRFRRLARALPPSAHAVPADGEAPHPGRARHRARIDRGDLVVWTPEALLTEFLDATADALVRRAVAEPAAPQPGRAGRRWEGRFIAALTAPDTPRRVLGDGFVERALLGELTDWVAPARGMAAVQSPRVCFKLDRPADGAPSDTTAAWTLGYFLQAPDDPSLLVPAERVWSATGRHLAWMDRRFDAPQETLLRGLALAGRLFAPIERSLEASRPESAALTGEEAWRFLSEGGPLLTEAGFVVRLPAELTPAGQRRLRLRLRVGGSRRGTPGAVAAGERLSLDALVAYRWEVALGDQPLSAQEFRALTALKQPLVRWRGQWLVVDPTELADVRRLLEASPEGRISVRDALAGALAGTSPREGLPVPAEVVPDGPLAAAIDRLRGEPVPLTPPAELVGTLRPYQERGLAWLGLMAELGLGGCLADDMGLGKTVQAIAFFLARRAARPDDPRPALIACPTSVVGNWERELARFAPSLPVVRHHGPDRARTPSGLAEAPPHAVVVTTYALLRRDQALLGEVDWSAAILDEAQNIKNAAAQQAAAARVLRASHRFALTGTPVENRLAELWSILEFCVPGLLGPLARFRRRFAIPIERYRDDRATAELRGLIRPFVLRRVKSDPVIVADLPPKQKMAVVCTLTREQATLYQAALDEALIEIEGASGIERRGRILALLTALKQICNHPAHYLAEPGPFEGRSGKLDRLTEMLEETVAAGDRALVFTQFREMGVRLVSHLERRLGIEALFLHGGVAREARDRMVGRFQEEGGAPPVFVLSLKAGGTGLNLTRASRVFHFDRWWNPAVEDQATDRAHRIGQPRLVQVYRLLTAGTVEERIDVLLADKRALADRIVGAGETWLTELSDNQLRQLVALSDDAVVESDDDGDAAPARRARRGRHRVERRR